MRRAAAGQFLIADQHVDAAVRDVNADAVTVLHQANRATSGRLGRAVANRQARGAAGKAPIGQQCTRLAQALALDVAGGVEHFLHAGAAFGAFVAHDDHIARLDLVAQDVGHGLVLAFNHVGRAFKYQNGIIHPGGFHHATIQGDVAHQDGQTAFFAESVLVRADAAQGTVQIQAGPAGTLAKGHLRGNATGAGFEEGVYGLILGAHHVPLRQGFAQGLGVHGGHIGVQFARALQLTQDGKNATGAVYVFHVVFLGIGRDLAQLRNHAREAVDVLHGEGDLRLLRNGQQVQDGVGRAAHGNVQRHGVFKGLETHRARQDAGIVAFVILAGQLNDAPPGAFEQAFAVGVGGQQGAIAWQGQAHGFGQAVHGVGGKHSRA